MQPDDLEPSTTAQTAGTVGVPETIGLGEGADQLDSDEEFARILQMSPLDIEDDLVLEPDGPVVPVAAIAAPRSIADDDVRSSHDRYRTVFASASLGTEEELSGAKIVMDVAASSIIGIARRSDSDEVLVEITRDIGAEGDTKGLYTIELRTTPTELADDGGWDRRVHALAYTVFQIENSAGGPIDPRPQGFYEIELFNLDHSIHFAGEAKVPSADRQATVAVAASELGFDPVAMAGTNRRQGHIHEYVSLQWYIEAFVYDDIAAAMGARGRFAYAFVLSAVARLAAAWTVPKQYGLLNRLAVKNAWDVRPRTPPIRILDTLSPDVRSLVRHAIQTRACPTADWVGARFLSGDLAALAVTWNLAKAQILSGLPMGGHNPPDAYVGSSDAMLFEYRTAPPGFARYFWDRARRGIEYEFDK